LLTRLGSGNYEPESWRKSVMRSVREGRSPRFWWTAKGRPRRAVTTTLHLAAWALAGGHRTPRPGRNAAATRREPQRCADPRSARRATHAREAEGGLEAGAADP